MKKRTKSKSKSITSIRKLAALVGVDEKAVRVWLKDGRWKLKKTPPWPASFVADVAEWRKQNLEQQPDDGDALEGLSAERREKIELVIERKLKVRLERELLAAKHIPREAAQADLVARVNAAKSILLNVEGLVARVVGKSELDVREVLTTHMVTACNALAGKAAA